MSVWWEQLSTLTKFFYFFAIPSTVVLLLQSVLTLIGFGMDGDGDFDFEGDTGGDFDLDFDPDIEPDFDLDLNTDGVNDFQDIASGADFRFVTLRGIIAFMTMFGWMGAALSNTDLHLVIVMVLAILAGLAGMFIIAMLFYGISKLQSSGNINYRNAIGQEATVYLPVPPNREGHGKVQLLLQERFVEINVVTEEDTMIRTHEIVRVIDLLDATTLVVERLK